MEVGAYHALHHLGEGVIEGASSVRPSPYWRFSRSGFRTAISEPAFSPNAPSMAMQRQQSDSHVPNDEKVKYIKWHINAIISTFMCHFGIFVKLI